MKIKKFNSSKIFEIILGGSKASFTIYWKAYGGKRALLSSRYLHMALILAIVVCLYRLGDQDWNWPSMVLSAIPNMLGFSLGGYAMLIGFGDRKFLKALKGQENDGTPSVYMNVSGAFVHFIVIQVVALLYAVLIISFNIKHFIANFIGMTFFFYAICTILAATFAVLNFASWYDKAE